MTKICLGTAAIGRPVYINIKTEKNNFNTEFNIASFKKDGIAFINEAYQLGIRHFDTAPSYGIAEEILFDCINNSLEFKDVEISSKWGYSYEAGFNLDAITHELKEHSLEKLKKQWQFTQKLLPQLKTYQIHSATLDTGVLNNKDVLNHLYSIKKQFSIKLGFTSSGENQNEIIKTALGITVNNEVLFDSLQVTYNVFEQQFDEIIELVKAKNIEVIIKESLANGRIFRNARFPHYNSLYDYIDVLSKKYNVGADAIALRFVIDALNPSIVLVGASNINQLKSNLLSKSFILTDFEIEKIRSLKIDSLFYWTERKNLEWN